MMLPSQFFKMFADETRLRCLILIATEGELCVCELTEALQMSQPKVSRHLAQLRQSGVLKDLRCGQWVYYRLSEDLPPWMDALIQSTTQTLKEQDHYQSDQARLKAMQVRPCLSVEKAEGQPAKGEMDDN